MKFVSMCIVTTHKGVWYKMASKKRVCHDKVKMVVLREDGYSLQQIVLKLKCNRSTVSRTLAKHRIQR